MKVLSLFDGISCGMVALERAGIPVDAYYASEIDKNAIAISQKNYPNIIRLGDVTKWRDWDIPWEISIHVLREEDDSKSTQKTCASFAQKVQSFPRRAV